MVALATGLMNKGHEVVICAPPENEELARQQGCRFVPFGPEIRKAIKERPEKQKGGIAVKISPKKGKKFTMDQMTRLPEIIRGAELVLGAGIVMGVHTAADIIQAAYRLVVFYPVILGTTAKDPLKNRLMFSFGRSMINLVMKKFINKERAKHSLPAIQDVWAHWMGEQVIVACDKELHAARKGVAFPFTQTAFMLLPSDKGLPQRVEEFLSSGKPPIYIGFGSNPIINAALYTVLFRKVRDQTNQRLIISKGWADLPDCNDRDILYVDELPFECLFPRMAAVVYHGGTGTMAAVARAGIPQAAFPFMGDQFSNRDQIVKLRLGPETVDFKKISAEAVSSAINACIMKDEYKRNALEMSEKLRHADGIDLTIKFLEKIFS
jgi:vancomycin aglycone glucosyltransferase